MVITSLNDKEIVIKECFFRIVDELKPTGKEVLRTLSYLIKHKW